MGSGCSGCGSSRKTHPFAIHPTWANESPPIEDLLMRVRGRRALLLDLPKHISNQLAKLFLRLGMVAIAKSADTLTKDLGVLSACTTSLKNAWSGDNLSLIYDVIIVGENFGIKRKLQSFNTDLARGLIRRTLVSMRVDSSKMPVVSVVTVDEDGTTTASNATPRVSRRARGMSSEFPGLDLGMTPRSLTSGEPTTPTAISRKVRHRRSQYSYDMINDYIMIEEVGKGSYGQVFHVRHNISGQSYALKVCLKQRMKNYHAQANGVWEANDKLRREVAIWRKLEHPHIVKLWEVIDDPSSEHIFMISDFMEGGVLANISRAGPSNSFIKEGYLSEEKASAAIRDAALGLQYLHSMCIVHRDIKPENLLYDSERRIRISDFGLSEQISPGDSIVGLMGTPVFLAPEIVSKEKLPFEPYGIDIWALGITLFTVLTGNLPFMGRDRDHIKASIREDDARFPITPSISSSARDLVSRMLEKDPARRINILGVLTHVWVSGSLLDAELSPILDSHVPEITEDEVRDALAPVRNNTLTLRGIIHSREILGRKASDAKLRLAHRYSEKLLRVIVLSPPVSCNLHAWDEVIAGLSLRFLNELRCEFYGEELPWLNSEKSMTESRKTPRSARSIDYTAELPDEVLSDDVQLIEVQTNIFLSCLHHIFKPRNPRMSWVSTVGTPSGSLASGGIHDEQ